MNLIFWMPFCKFDATACMHSRVILFFEVVRYGMLVPLAAQPLLSTYLYTPFLPPRPLGLERDLFGK